MKHIGFKHHRESKQNSDNDWYNRIHLIYDIWMFMVM